MTEASASGADLDTLSEELFRQLSSGQTVNLGAMFRPTKSGPGLESAGAEPSKPQATPAQQQQHLQRAARAISAAAAAAAVNQGTTPAVLLGTNDQSGSGQLEGAPAASVSGLIRVASEAPAPAVPRCVRSCSRVCASACSVVQWLLYDMMACMPLPPCHMVSYALSIVSQEQDV